MLIPTGEDCEIKACRIVKETTEHWSERNQCWGEDPSVSYWCLTCENYVEIEEMDDVR